MEDEELNALLGKNLDLTELTKPVVPAKEEPKGELAKVDTEQLESKILAEHEEILDHVKSAVADVLMQVQTTPNDGELVEGAAKLVNSYSGLLNGLHKIYTVKEKFRQQVVLQTNKILANDKMNQDNNNTRILMSREQILKTLDKKKQNNEVIDVTEKHDEQ